MCLLCFLSNGMAFATHNFSALNISSEFVVPDKFFNSGDLHVIGAGSIKGDLFGGNILNIGKDTGGNINPNNFSASGTIRGIPTIHVFNGSTFSSDKPISGVTNALIIDPGANAIFNSKITGAGGEFRNNGNVTINPGATIAMTGMFINNGALNIANDFKVTTALVNTGSYHVIASGKIEGNLNGGNTINIGQDSNGKLSANHFTPVGIISDFESVHVHTGSAFTATKAITNIHKQFIVDAGANFSTNAELSGNGVFANHGTTLIKDAGLVAMSSGFNNAGEVYIIGDGSIRNNIYGIATSSIIVGQDNQGNLVPTHFTTNGAIDNISNLQISKNSSLTIAHQIYNSNIHSSGNIYLIGTETILSNLNGDSNITLHVGCDRHGTLRDNTFATTYGIKNVSEIRVYGGSRLTLNNMVSTVDSFIVNTLAQAKLNAQLTNILTFNNAGNVELANSIAAQSFKNSGNIRVIGKQNVTANSFINTGTLSFFITNRYIYDSLATNSKVDIINDGRVSINSSFFGEPNRLYSWPVLSAKAINIDSNSKIILPATNAFETWNSNIKGGTLNITYQRNSFQNAANDGTNKCIAAALDALPTHHPDNITLLRGVMASVTSQDYNKALATMAPNASPAAHHRAVQNNSMNKVEARVVGVRTSAQEVPGIAYGDVTPNTAAWLAGFGSVASQKINDNNPGYNATASGFLIGLDRKCDDEDIIGFAIGISNSNIDEVTNEEFKTRILGYHLLFYGSQDIFYEDTFLEWLLSGVNNKNNNIRYVKINNVNLGVNSSYRTSQGAIRINLGQYTDLDNWRLSEIATLQYSLLYQPAYNEQNSIAALHVEPNKYSSVLTVGAGARLSWIGCEDEWLVGTRELRAMVTYDVVTSSQATTANFIISSADFTISSGPSRTALQLGADFGFIVQDHWQLQFSYDFELRTKYTDNSGQIQLRYLF